MNELNINLSSDTNSFTAGQTIEGTISWKLDEDPENITLALHWFTKSRAAEQSGMTSCLELHRPGRENQKPFSFPVPYGPYSLNGRYLSLNWVIELAPSPGIGLTRQPIVISPTGRPINL